MNLIKPSFSTGYAKNASESANPNLWKGLVGAWMPSFGVTGGTLKDVSGNGNDGTLTNMDAATDWVGTSKGLALEFDGSNDRVDIAGTVTGELTKFSAGCSFWLNVHDFTNGEGMFSQWGHGGIPTLDKWQLAIQPNRTLTAYIKSTNGSNYGVNGITVSDKSWLNVFMTVDGYKISLFANGVLLGQTSYAGDVRSTTHYLTIGAYNNIAGNAQHFNGKVKNAFAYNRALSPSEIKQLYLNPSAPFQKKTTTVVSVPATPVTTTAKAVVLKKPKPSYATGYARNASESANPNLWKGLVGAWMPSFGVTGGTLKDVSGNGNDGTLTAGMDLASDWLIANKQIVLDFDGVDDGVSVTANFAEQFTEGFTICSLVKTRTTSSKTNAIAGEWGNGGAGNASYLLYQRYSKFYAATYNTALGGLSIQSSQNILANKWYHLVFTHTYDGGAANRGTGKLWIQGRLDATLATMPTPQQSTNYPFTIGKELTTNANAQIGFISLHKRVLSPTEIKQLYLNPSAPFERKQQTVGISTAQAFNPYWANQATQLAGTLQ